jgi:hypothetical protein
MQVSNTSAITKLACWVTTIQNFRGACFVMWAWTYPDMSNTIAEPSNDPAATSLPSSLIATDLTGTAEARKQCSWRPAWGQAGGMSMGSMNPKDWHNASSGAGVQTPENRDVPQVSMMHVSKLLFLPFPC